MNICWVMADDAVIDPRVSIEQIKDIGSIWGSWRTWRSCGTDNVICHSGARAQDLLNKNLHTMANLYVPTAVHAVLDVPGRIMAYGGDFAHDVDRPEELVALHLAASTSDIVLLLGFDWPNLPESAPATQINYHHLVYHAISQNPDTQWVLVDPPKQLRSDLVDLENFTQDSLSNIIELMRS